MRNNPFAQKKSTVAQIPRLFSIPSRTATAPASIPSARYPSIRMEISMAPNTASLRPMEAVWFTS